jgi:type I restriction enzyme S subunit
MELKAGYKKTEMGVIPEDWVAKPLAGLIVIIHGFGFKSQYFKPLGHFRLTTPGHFYETGGFRDVGDKQKFYDGPLPDGYLLSEGDLLVAMTEQAGGLLGSAAFVPTCGTYLHNQRLGKIEVLSSKISIRFLYRVFNSENYRAKVRETAAGTKVKHTSPSKLLEIPILLPPTIVEQDAIAAALSDVDALIAALDRLIAKKRDIKHAAMQELLTGKRRLTGFGNGNGYKKTDAGLIPRDWDITTIEGICITNGLIRGPFGGALKKEFFVDDGYKVYEQKNAINQDAEIGEYYITKEKFYELKRFEAKEGDFIVSCSGTIGKIFQIPIGSKQGIINQALLKVKINDEIMLDKFFYYIFNQDSFQIRVIDKQGGAMQNLVGMDIIRKIPIVLPLLSEQRAIAYVLSSIDAEIAAIETRREKTLALKQGMMQELLTGRIRLVQEGAA